MAIVGQEVVEGALQREVVAGLQVLGCAIETPPDLCPVSFHLYKYSMTSCHVENTSIPPVDFFFKPV